MKKIKLTQNKYALIDNSYFEYLNQWKWYVAHNKRNYYAVRMDNDRKIIGMHRLILDTLNTKKLIDHINGNGLDNRRKNLRVCSNQENLRNGRLRVNNKSGYKGVSWEKDRKSWMSYIYIDGKRKRLGRFKNKIMAAKVYDTNAIKYFGEFAQVNIYNLKIKCI